MRGYFRLRAGWFYENSVFIKARGRKQHKQCLDVTETETHCVSSGHLNALSALPVTCEVLGKAVSLGGLGIFVFNFTDTFYAMGGGENQITVPVREITTCKTVRKLRFTCHRCWQVRSNFQQQPALDGIELLNIYNNWEPQRWVQTL